MRAGLVKRAWDWPWSSAAGHASGRGDVLVAAGGPLPAEVSDWRRLLSGAEDAEAVALLRRHGRTGGPLGDVGFVSALESLLGRRLAPGRPGRPRQGRN